MTKSIRSVIAGATFPVALLLVHAQPESIQPIASEDLVFEEIDGLVAFEAEHFYRQDLTDIRAWHLTTAEKQPGLKPDIDGPHVLGASGGAYLEILPDNRWSHNEPLITGENFSNEPGKLAILSYKVHFNNPGRYHVWVRNFSTNGEDNGMHFGVDGEWPASGQRWQTVKKRAWQWDSRQRTEEVHVGVPGQLFLDIDEPGVRVINLSMREDGTEVDRILLTSDPDFVPEGIGPDSRVKSGKMPPVFPIPDNYTEAAPEVMGQNRPVMASGVHATGNIVLPLAHFDFSRTNFYIDRDKWAAINPEEHREASVKGKIPVANGTYSVTIHAVGENDGSSTYEVLVDGKSLGEFVCPLSNEMFEEGDAFNHTWRAIEISEGAPIEVRAKIGSADGNEFSRARWSKIVVMPAGEPHAAAKSEAAKEFPKHWGEPPAIQTRDYVPLPGDYGHGSSTLAAWILGNLEKDAAVIAAKPAREMRNGASSVEPRGADGDGSVVVSGELKQWHKVTIDLAGPYANELDNVPNPFTDYRYHVEFTHESGSPVYSVPGYFAADGDAAETSSSAGTVWRAHFAADRTGTWNFRVSFVKGDWAAVQPSVGEPFPPYDGAVGTITIAKSDKSGRDFRGKGRLGYVGGHYLQHLGSGEFFLKAGPDAPETLLAYSDFDGTERGRKQPPRPGEAEPRQELKTWAPHVQDWSPDDPSWQGGRGRGLIGALNYLAGKGVNSFSFLPYNAGGDGDNVWPFVSRMDKFHYDCSKLDQWSIVFDHAQKLGLHLHFKLQENEIDDYRAGHAQNHAIIPEAMDGGELGPERKLYFRELIARFGHNLALNWNLGEENTQSYEQQRDMAAYINLVDPYDHNIVIHTFPNEQDKIYPKLLGHQSMLTGVSAQNSWDHAHRRTLQWVRESQSAGRPWVVANDEQGPANLGVPPDPGYDGFSGNTEATEKQKSYNLHDIRKSTLWGNLMAGGAGVEYYFGYALPENDLVAEDWRSRDMSWDYCRIALNFFRDEEIPFWHMENRNALIGNIEDDNSKYCFAKTNELYLVYLAHGGTTEIDLSEADGRFSVYWFNPRSGGKLTRGSVRSVHGGESVALGNPPADADEDWLIVIRR